MPIVLHIGSHKTGTTAIQRLLSRNREVLRTQGVWYPSEAELLEGGCNYIPHLNIARSLDFSPHPKHYSIERIEEITAALVRGSRNFETTILSAEAFWRIGFGGNALCEDLETLWRRKEENILRIRELLVDADVRVVAVLRERTAFIQSSYQEFVLATYYKKPIQKFIRQFSYIPDYLRQLNAWQQHFPLQVLSYEDLCRSLDLPRAFLNAVAGPVALLEEDDPSQQHVNVGHPIACVVYKRYLNRIVAMPRERRIRLYNKARRQFSRAGHNSTVAKLNTINSWLNAEEIRLLRRSYRKDDTLIRQRFCPQFVSGPCGRKAISAESLVVLDREAALMALGWMLGKRLPGPEWFARVES